MSPSNRKSLVIAAFAAPVILCFIGMGALLNMLVSSMQEEQLAGAELSKEYDDAVAENQRRRDELESQRERATRAGEEKEKAEKAADEDRAKNKEAEEVEKKAAKSEAANAARRKRILEEQAATAPLPKLREENGRLNVSAEDLRKKLREADDEFRQLKIKCDVARKEKDKERRKVDVTALDGTRKISDHQPVFVECSRFKAILQPQARPLGPNASPDDRNAFLTAARGTRYVVFLIRPDGFPCFQKYRACLLAANKESGTSIEFGYEPVNADWELVFPGKEG